MKKAQKVNRRNKAEYVGLKPQYNLKNRQELIDFDYINKLSDKDKLVVI